jgi:endonuclease-3
MTARDRAALLLGILRETYPDAHCELEYRNPLELLIATILSAQCTDARVNMVTRELFAVCKTAGDYVALPLERLEELVKTTGFYRAKAKHIRSCCERIVAEHGGEVPQEMDALVRLPGVGRKTANVVLGNAFGIEAGIVVDTHVQRLSQRLQLCRVTTPEKIEEALMKLVPQTCWTMFSHWLIWHGRRRCGALRPDCGLCELRAHCPSAGKAVNKGRKKPPGKTTARQGMRGRAGKGAGKTAERGLSRSSEAVG